MHIEAKESELKLSKSDLKKKKDWGLTPRLQEEERK
jgi:hypothetical protein